MLFAGLEPISAAPLHVHVLPCHIPKREFFIIINPDYTKPIFLFDFILLISVRYLVFNA